jgi:hypothetical protein
MSMSKTTILVIAVILIFIAAVVYALFHLGEVNKREVVNRYYGSEFSFTYPLGYELEEYDNGSISIGSTTQNGFVSVVDLTIMPLPADVANVNEYMREQILTLCAADGPNERISCSAVESEEKIDTINDESATMYYLTLTREVPGQEPETRSYGPVFVYVIGPDRSGETPIFSALIVHNPLPATLSGAADMTLLTRINDSLKIGEVRR